MDRPDFDAAQPHLDKIAELLDKAFESDLVPLRDALAALGKELGSRYSVALDCTINVFDRERERGLRMLTTGLATSDEGDPYQTSGDSTAAKYVVDGEIQVVPHDCCPGCWETWDFKTTNRSCSNCGATLGDNVKILLDTDVCPSCEEGKVSMANPICDKCGVEVDLKLVAWG
jgi:hypothetical protein